MDDDDADGCVRLSLCVYLYMYAESKFGAYIIAWGICCERMLSYIYIHTYVHTYSVRFLRSQTITSSMGILLIRKCRRKRKWTQYWFGIFDTLTQWNYAEDSSCMSIARLRTIKIPIHACTRSHTHKCEMYKIPIWIQEEHMDTLTQWHMVHIDDAKVLINTYRFNHLKYVGKYWEKKLYFLSFRLKCFFDIAFAVECDV